MKKEFTVTDDGFCGKLFLSEQPWDKEKVLLICGGSDGSFKSTTLLADTLSKQGIDTLALAYINAPGLPKHTIEAPLESAINASEYLNSINYKKIGIYGISSGGEYAQLAATYTRRISNVIAVSAPTAISQADNGISSKATSCWSWQGKKLPYIPVGYSLIKALPKTIVKRELYTAHLYEQAITRASEDAWIKVEKINGNILYLTAESDSICPGSRFAKIALERLKKYKFIHEFKHLNYEFGSHFLLPIEHPKEVPTRVIKVERKYPAECASARLDSLEKTVQWLKNW